MEASADNYRTIQKKVVPGFYDNSVHVGGQKGDGKISTQPLELSFVVACLQFCVGTVVVWLISFRATSFENKGLNKAIIHEIECVSIRMRVMSIRKEGCVCFLRVHLLIL